MNKTPDVTLFFGRTHIYQFKGVCMLSFCFVSMLQFLPETILRRLQSCNIVEPYINAVMSFLMSGVWGFFYNHYLCLTQCCKEIKLCCKSFQVVVTKGVYFTAIFLLELQSCSGDN